MEKFGKDEKTVIFASDLTRIQDLHRLKKIGAGHDGIIYRYNDQALKELKYDINTRKQKGLMTFEKVQYFVEWSNEFKRIVGPTDILLDQDGIFCGYAMDLIEKINLDEYPLREVLISTFLEAIYELNEDFNVLNSMHTVAKDINSGSYIFDTDFMHICDLDKYIVYLNGKNVARMNREAYNYMIAKFLYSLMYQKDLSKESLKKLYRWVGYCSQSINFLNALDRELEPIINEPLGEYTDNLKRKLIK